MLNNKSIYFPAASLSVQLNSLKDEYVHMKTGKSFNYLKKEGIFYNPYVLISAGHNYKKETKKIINYNLEEVIVLGDSGGYQIASEKLVLTEQLREQIFKWLEENTNYAINLDIPPYGAYSNRKKSIFEDNTAISIDNFKYFKENSSGKTKYLNVLHGRGLEDLNYWYDRVKDFNFEGGWSIGSVFGNIYYMLLSFFYLWEKGEIRKYSDMNALIHFLGFSKNSCLYIILYLQEKLNELNTNINISYDSSSYSMMAAYGKYSMFSKKEGNSTISFSSSILKNKEFINLDIPLFCDCPVCQSMLLSDLFSFAKEEGFGSDFYYYLAMHNLYSFLNYKKIMENFLLCANKSIYSSLFSSKDMRLFAIIDKAFESKNPSQTIVDNKNILASLLDEPEIIIKKLF